MTESVGDLSRRLADQAEAVCRHYLSNGQRIGGYWIVGDVCNTPGQSMYVRLTGRARGRWTDAATGQFGDLIDLIRENCALLRLAEAIEEANRFLGDAPRPASPRRSKGARPKEGASARRALDRLISQSQPIRRTHAEAYLAHRGICETSTLRALRYHPYCYYHSGPGEDPETWPAMIGLVTNLKGAVTGIQRTWLDPDGFDASRLGKAPVATPRRALGKLRGHAVRFGVADAVMAAGEGIETVLSVRAVLPEMPMLASLSASNLAAVQFPDALRRLYVIRDNDPAGDGAVDTLLARAAAAGVEALILTPQLSDFNEDIRITGPDGLAALLRTQLLKADAERLMPV